MNFYYGSHFRTLPAWYDTDFSSDIYGYGDVHVLYESFNPPGQDEKFFRIHHAFLPDGISFSNIHRSFALTCIRKHQKKILYWQCARSKRGMQYPCNLSMIFEYPLFQTPERKETSQKKHPASLHTPWSTMLIVCYIHLFFDAYASSSSNG